MGAEGDTEDPPPLQRASEIIIERGQDLWQNAKMGSDEFHGMFPEPDRIVWALPAGE